MWFLPQHRVPTATSQCHVTGHVINNCTSSSFSRVAAALYLCSCTDIIHLFHCSPLTSAWRRQQVVMWPLHRSYNTLKTNKKTHPFSLSSCKQGSDLSLQSQTGRNKHFWHVSAWRHQNACELQRLNELRFLWTELFQMSLCYRWSDLVKCLSQRTDESMRIRHGEVAWLSEVTAAQTNTTCSQLKGQSGLSPHNNNSNNTGLRGGGVMSVSSTTESWWVF